MVEAWAVTLLMGLMAESIAALGSIVGTVAAGFIAWVVIKLAIRRAKLLLLGE
jgi:hypothetical protein